MEQRRCLLFAVALLTAIPLSENFEVTSPQNVVGVVGQDTILPCHVSSTKPLDNIEVKWKKITDGLIEDIHTYRQQSGGKAAQKYLGRTSLPTDGFATGNVSLTLKNVQPADEGTYSCFVKSRHWSADTATVLSIAGTSEVFFEILGPRGQGLELACRSHGWFPKPTVQWGTQNKQRLSPDTAIHQDSKQLFSVLSRVTVTGEEVGEVTCQILNPLVKTEKKTTVRLSPKQRASRKKSSEEKNLQEHGIEKSTQDADHEELKARCGALTRELEFRRARSHMVRISLDEAWKHSELAVSPDQRTVEHKPSTQRPITERQLPIVVGREGFASGHHYWEVQVWDGLDWELGVLTETVRGRLKERSWEELPEDGVWSLRRVNGKYWPEEANTVIQSPKVQLPVVGLALDFEQSTLSFYNIVTSDCILEVSIEGSTKLYPFLRPGLGEAGEKGKPLTINHNTDWDFPHTVCQK
ncbi:butyrophilin subfamily 1 member A1-like [Theristicus caerulescens]